MMVYPGDYGDRKYGPIVAIIVAVIVAIGGVLVAGINRGWFDGQPPQPPQTDTATPRPTPNSPVPATSVPVPPAPKELVEHVATLRMPGNLKNGIQYSIGKTGTYRFTYVSGAYSVYVPGTQPAGFDPWLTSVIGFRGGTVPFNGKVLIKDADNAIMRLADVGYSATKEQAEARAKTYPNMDVDLKAGETISLVGVDEIQAYGDNPGTVIVDLSFVTWS